MPISRRTLLTSLAAAPFVSLLPRAAWAAYPDHPIRLIVPFAAGGNADFVARIVAEGMSRALGQSIVVESRAGAGGSLGADLVAKSPPDGYTLLTGSNGPLTVNPVLQPKLPYDVATELAMPPGSGRDLNLMWDRTRATGAVELLGSLHEAGVGLAICTNKPEEITARVLEQLDLARWFGAVIGESARLPRTTAQTPLRWSEDESWKRNYASVDPARIALWGTSFSGGHVLVA